MKTSSQEEVQTWFKTHRNGKFLEYAQLFAKADGTDLLSFSKEDLQKFCKDDVMGSVLYTRPLQ